jgi:hypothetical protein
MPCQTRYRRSLLRKRNRSAGVHKGASDSGKAGEVRRAPPAAREAQKGLRAGEAAKRMAEVGSQDGRAMEELGVEPVESRQGPRPANPAVSQGRVSNTLEAPWRQALRNTALLVICHDRHDYLERSLRSILKYHPGGALAPIVISEDGMHPHMAVIVQQFTEKFRAEHPELRLLHLHHHPDPQAENGYFKLAAHYKWALNQVKG